MALNHRIAHRYAVAIKQLSDERGETDTLYGEFLKISRIILTSSDLRVFLKSPVIQSDIKIKALGKLLGVELSLLMKLFIEKLTKSRRENLLGEIAREYIEMCDAERGKVTAYIKTAFPLSEELKTEIKSRVLNQISSDGTKVLELVDDIKPDLIGGFILQVGDKRIDASYKGKITLLKREFNKNLYIKDF